MGSFTSGMDLIHASTTIMKLLIAAFLLIAVSMFGANPSYEKFIGAGGIVITPNPPNGTIIIDGSGVVASGTNSSIRVSSNAVAVTVAATNLNFMAGHNLELTASNINSAAHLRFALKSNLLFNTDSGPMLLGAAGSFFGFSNVTTGVWSMWLDETDISDVWMFRNGINLGGNLFASNATFATLPGVGVIVAASPSGILYRTNYAGGISSINENTAAEQFITLGTNIMDASRSPTMSNGVNGVNFNFPWAAATVNGLLHSNDWARFNSGVGGTPGGTNYSVQWNSNQVFQGDTMLQYHPQEWHSENFGPSLDVGRLGGSTNIMDPYGFTVLGNNDINFRTPGPTTVRWKITSVAGHLIPGASNGMNIGSLLLPSATNFFMAMQMHPNAGNGKVLTSDANGFGSWQTPSGGGASTVLAGQSVTVETNGAAYTVSAGLKDLLMDGTNRIAFSNGIAFALSPDGITNNALYFVSTNGTYPALVWRTSLDEAFHGVGFQPNPDFSTILDTITTYTGASLGTLRMRSVHLTNGAVAGYVWTSTDTSGAGTWQPAGGGGTPSGPTNSLQYNAAGSFAGSAGMQIRPSNSVAGVLSDMLVMSTGGPDSGNAVYLDAFGVGARSLGSLIIGTSNGTPRWEFVLNGGFVPSVSNNVNVGTRLKPVGTNFTMAYQMHPNARNNRTMRSDDNGFGTWSPNPAGGNEATGFVPAGGIQFAQTNTDGSLGYHLDSTNKFVYDRTNNAIELTDTGDGSALRIKGYGIIETGDNKDLLLGVGSSTNWFIEGDASVVWLGSFAPVSSNLFSIGLPTSTVSNVYANKLTAKESLTVGEGSGLAASVKFYSTNGVNYVEETGGQNIQTNMVILKETNATAGVRVLQPAGTGTNQAHAVALTAGQYVTYNGTAYVASNLPSAGGGATPITQSNGWLRLQIQSCILPTNNMPSLDTGTNYVWRLLFDDTTDESAYWEFVVPDDYGTNATVVCTYSTLVAAASKTNCFQFTTQILRPTVSNNINVSSFADSGGVTNVIPTSNGWSTNFSGNLSLAILPGDMVRLKVNRDADNSMDSSSGDTALHAIAIRYTKR